METESGEYKLLCLVKDMYSTKNFDTRAVINFKVKKYKELTIKNFTADLNSPQLTETPINIKVLKLLEEEKCYIDILLMEVILKIQDM